MQALICIWKAKGNSKIVKLVSEFDNFEPRSFLKIPYL